MLIIHLKVFGLDVTMNLLGGIYLKRGYSHCVCLQREDVMKMAAVVNTLLTLLLILHFGRGE